MTLAELITARDDLQKVIDGGIVEVRFGERWIKYQPLTEMRQRLSDLNEQIASASSGSSPRSMCNLTEFKG